MYLLKTLIYTAQRKLHTNSVQMTFSMLFAEKVDLSPLLDCLSKLLQREKRLRLQLSFQIGNRCFSTLTLIRSLGPAKESLPVTHYQNHPVLRCSLDEQKSDNRRSKWARLEQLDRKTVPLGYQTVFSRNFRQKREISACFLGVKPTVDVFST